MSPDCSQLQSRGPLPDRKHSTQSRYSQAGDVVSLNVHEIIKPTILYNVSPARPNIMPLPRLKVVRVCPWMGDLQRGMTGQRGCQNDSVFGTRSNLESRGLDSNF
jgi:hypothetical protein